MTPDLPLSRIPDDELQNRISRFGVQMLEAEARYARTGEPADRAERDRCWIAKRGVLLERSRRERCSRELEDEREIERLREENAALRQALREGRRSA